MAQAPYIANKFHERRAGRRVRYYGFQNTLNHENLMLRREQTVVHNMGQTAHSEWQQQQEFRVPRRHHKVEKTLELRVI